MIKACLLSGWRQTSTFTFQQLILIVFIKRKADGVDCWIIITLTFSSKR